jgi:hypothetical protein
MHCTPQARQLRIQEFTGALFVAKKMSPLMGIRYHLKTTTNIRLAQVRYAGS